MKLKFGRPGVSGRKRKGTSTAESETPANVKLPRFKVSLLYMKIDDVENFTPVMNRTLYCE